MPRKLNAEEIQAQKDYMYRQTIPLIRKKGLRNLTLEDITKATQMAKGSFYYYYPSKEVFLYEVIRKNEKQSFDFMLSQMKSVPQTKEDILPIFESIFLSEDFLFCYILPSEFEYLIRHLPPALQEDEAKKSHSNFNQTSELFGLHATEENYGTLSYLLDGLQAIIRDSTDYGEAGRKRAIKIVINSICDFFVEEID